MRYPSDHVRTTLALDQKATEDLKFLEKYHKGIGRAIDQATRFFRPDYQSTYHFRDDSPVKVDRTDSILKYAKDLEAREKLSQCNKAAKVRKSIVIDKTNLALVNKISKEKKVKRDFIFISAIRHERDSSYGLLQFELKLKKDFVENVLKKITSDYETEMERYIQKLEKFMESKRVFDINVLYFWDIDCGLTTPYSTIHESLENAVRESEEDISEWGEIL